MQDALQREIEAYLAENWGQVVADIDELVRVESTEDLAAAAPGAPFGPGPREALDRALGIAGRMGFETHDCEGYIGYADLPGESATQVGIIGHVDVVPAGPAWSFPPYEVTRRDGYLVGRGVIDDKGPLLVALHAVKFWKDRGQALPYTVRVLFGANEETDMKDVAYYRDHYADPAFLFTPDSQFPVGYGEAGICSGELVSESISEGAILALEGGQAVNAVPGHARAVVRGPWRAPAAEGIVVSLQADGATVVEATGISAHAIDYAQGVNAIGLLASYLVDAGACSPQESAFLGLVRDLADAPDGSAAGLACSDGHFGGLSQVCGVISLQDGRIRQSVDFRYPTTITAHEIERRMKDAAARAGADFRMLHDKEPFLMDPASPAVTALLDAYNDVTGENRAGVTSKGGTYARMFTTGVSFGPEKPWEQAPDWVGGMHGPDEGVSEELLKQAFRIYAHTIGKLMQLEL